MSTIVFHKKATSNARSNAWKHGDDTPGMNASQPLPIDLTRLDQTQFIDRFGGLYEHSPWIAEKVWTKIQSQHSISVDALASRLKETVDSSTNQQKMDLLCAHPELAGKAATQGTLTADSTEEQSRARLDLCSAQEYEKFQQLNAAYNEKFKFPFIMAVRESSRAEILEAFEMRLQNASQDEFETALEQVHRIARLRLEATLTSPSEQA